MNLISKITLISLFSLTAVLFSMNVQVGAISPSAFKAERIIDDSVFYNTNAFPNAQAVQDFITNHTPACDTWGTQPSGYGSLNRAQYAQQIKGWPGPPYVCLQNYHENPDTGQTSYEMGGGWFSGGKSAGQIIWDAAQTYGINPQVLLVFLKKESAGPLFSDSWPLKSQYKYAMGYACPDSGPGYSASCDANKAGFYKQMMLAAWQLRYYVNNIGSYNYQPGRWNYIQYDTDPACGGKNVFIENIATASLYIYTPYTPTTASLNAYPGEVHCGAYGNRNFFMYFNEWFGSTNADVTITSPLRVTSGYSTGLYTKVPTTVSFTIKNNRNYAIGIGSMAVSVRDGAGRNLDYPLQPVTIPAYGTYTYTSQQILPREENYSFEIVNYNAGAWRTDYPESSSVFNNRDLDAVAYEMPTQTASINFSNELRVGRDTTVSFSIKNNSATGSVNAGRFGIAVRGPNNENYDLAPDTVTLTANQTYVYSKTFRPPTTGTYKFFIANTLNNGVTWETNFPLPQNNSIQNETIASVKPGITINQSLQAEPSPARTGQYLDLSFKIRNYSSSTVNLGKVGLSGRSPAGSNIDPGVVDVVLNPDEEKTLSFSPLLTAQGIHRYAVISTQGGGVWGDGPVGEDGSILKSVSVNVGAGVTITQGPTVSAIPHVGQSLTISLKVKNYGDISADIGKLGLMGRGPNGQNMDPGVVSTTLAPNEERTLSFPMPTQLHGTYRYSVLGTLNNGLTWNSGPVADGSSVSKDLSQFVRPSVTIIEGISASIPSPSVGQVVAVSFKVKNFTTSTVNLGKLGLSGRSPSGQNIDPGVVPTSLTPGEERLISFNFTPSITGNYTFSLISTQDNGASWNGGPDLESTGQTNRLTVQARN